MSKKTVCVDFDGVVHSYERGWQGGEIYGTVVPGFFEWLEALDASGEFRAVVYSSRSADAEMREAMERWLVGQVLDYCETRLGPDVGESHRQLFVRLNRNLECVADKPPAWVTVDDRAWLFRGPGSWPSVQQLRDFRPWNQPRDHEEDWKRSVTLTYENWMLETRTRTLVPTGRNVFTSNKWHPGPPQWMVEAYDPDSCEVRLFPLANFRGP